MASDPSRSMARKAEIMAVVLYPSLAASMKISQKAQINGYVMMRELHKVHGQVHRKERGRKIKAPQAGS